MTEPAAQTTPALRRLDRAAGLAMLGVAIAGLLGGAGDALWIGALAGALLGSMVP
jgi:hypothetical protein